jgi:hypothetical protein
VLDKLQVFAISLNREKFAGKPTGSIRRKFSIDDACAIPECFRARPRFRNHTARLSGNPAFTIRAECNGRRMQTGLWRALSGGRRAGP